MQRPRRRVRLKLLETKAILPFNAAPLADRILPLSRPSAAGPPRAATRIVRRSPLQRGFGARVAGRAAARRSHPETRAAAPEATRDRAHHEPRSHWPRRSRRSRREHDRARRNGHRCGTERLRADARRTLWPAAQPRRRAPTVDRHRHGQARWTRAERLIGHRPDLRLPGGGGDRRCASDLEFRILYPAGAQPDQRARRNHRRRSSVSCRYAFETEWRFRSAGVLIRDAGKLLLHPGPRLGALCVDQGAAAHRRALGRARSAPSAVRVP